MMMMMMMMMMTLMIIDLYHNILTGVQNREATEAIVNKGSPFSGQDGHESARAH